jgi:hypothetical protein
MPTGQSKVLLHGHSASAPHHVCLDPACAFAVHFVFASCISVCLSLAVQDLLLHANLQKQPDK